MKRAPSFEETYKMQSEADEIGREFWFNDVVFSYQWWLLVAVTIIPFIIWWKIVDRKRLFEISTYGLLILVFSGLLDAIGVELDAWEYKYDLLPLLDVFIVYDISVLPVTYMIIYQYFPNWRSFVIACGVVALVFSFVSEPLLIWLDIFQLVKWKHIYSVPGFFFLPIFLRWVMGRFMNKSQSP